MGLCTSYRGWIVQRLCTSYMRLCTSYMGLCTSYMGLCTSYMELCTSYMGLDSYTAWLNRTQLQTYIRLCTCTSYGATYHLYIYIYIYISSVYVRHYRAYRHRNTTERYLQLIDNITEKCCKHVDKIAQTHRQRTTLQLCRSLWRLSMTSSRNPMTAA